MKSHKTFEPQLGCCISGRKSRKNENQIFMTETLLLIFDLYYLALYKSTRAFQIQRWSMSKCTRMDTKLIVRLVCETTSFTEATNCTWDSKLCVINLYYTHGTNCSPVSTFMKTRFWLLSSICQLSKHGRVSNYVIVSLVPS